jgi:Ni,Fe-hydrogenase I large subunit
VKVDNWEFFANGYWGHSAYKLPAEINLIGVAHYLEALEWQKDR